MSSHWSDPQLSTNSPQSLVLIAAFLTRAQAVALGAAYITSIVATAATGAKREGVEARYRFFFRHLRRFQVTWLIFAAGAGTLVAGQWLRGKSLIDFLAVDRPLGHVNASAIPQWFVWHLADLDLYIGVIPFAALPVIVSLALRRPDTSASLRALVTTSIALSFWMLLMAAAFATQPLAGGIHERYLFHLAPLFFVLFLVWIERGMARPRAPVLVGSALAVALPLTVPYADIADLSNYDALALVPWTTSAIPVAMIPAGVFIATAILLVIFLRLSPKRRFVAPAIVCIYLYAVGGTGQSWLSFGSRVATGYGVPAERDWIDQAVEPDARVALVWPAVGDGRLKEQTLFRKGRVVWENEFFNRSVGPIYYVGVATRYRLHHVMQGAEEFLGLGQRLTVHNATLCTAGRRPVTTDYVLAESSLGLRGHVVAKDLQAGMALYRVDGLTQLRTGTSQLSQPCGGS